MSDLCSGHLKQTEVFGPTVVYRCVDCKAEISQYNGRVEGE